MVINKVSIEDLRRFKFVSDPQISPDGKKIAYVHTEINYEADAYERHIWMIDRATGVARQFTNGLSRDSYPRWSPDGRWLLFLSRGRQPDKKTQAWVIPTNGGEARLLADSAEGINSPSWTPDSNGIIYISQVWTEEKPKTDVLVIKRQYYRKKSVGILEGRRFHIFIKKFGEEPRQMTKGEFDVDVAKLSPDGKTIAYIRSMDEVTSIRKEDAYGKFRDVLVMPANGGEAKVLTGGKHVITDLFWSPDSDKIAYLGHDDHLLQATNVDIWIQPAKGGKSTNITASLDRNHRGLGTDVIVGTPWPGAVWSTDSANIYFMTGGIPTANIYKVQVGNEKITQITSGRNIMGFSMSGSILVYLAGDATHLADIWVKDEIGERQLTRANEALWNELSFSVPEQYKWTNELGDEIDGWIMKPQDFDSGKKYPAILQIHGGPRAIYGNSMYHEFQILASEGYVVFYTNPRGSGGYTEAYSASMYGYKGIVDYKDLMDFVDQTLERYDFIDPEKLGVTGGSYGGFMTNWIETQTTRFAAAVACRSSCNALSGRGESDNQYRPQFFKDGSAAFPWDREGEEAMMRASPIRYVDKAKTPILIIHSEKDMRSSILNANQFFIALKEHGVETEFVRFPDEGHELSRSGKPRHREERLQHIVRWFNKYLK